MLLANPASLMDALEGAGDLSACFLHDVAEQAPFSDLIQVPLPDSVAYDPYGRSILIATSGQFATAAMLCRLDGAARRIVLVPPDVPLEQLPAIALYATADAIISDRLVSEKEIAGIPCLSPKGKIGPRCDCARIKHQTEWVLVTSGTTAQPKLVVHNVASLAGGLVGAGSSTQGTVWSTFYDIRRYGGLQIFFRALLSGCSLVLSNASESTADFLARAGARGVTHISGTPSHWRRALMSPASRLLAPKYVRLSGEIADQSILNQLATVYPQARIAHAFASTEAGVAFEVNDGMTGFAKSIIDHTARVEMKIENASLHIRSERTASCYLGNASGFVKDAEGWVDTGDVLELRDDRYHFVGRRDGVINVGGFKVHPEEVEQVINRHPQVRMSLVRTRRNPITGALVVADVVLNREAGLAGKDEAQIQKDILLLCREELPSHKVPATINFVPALGIAETGKMIRRLA